METEAGQSETTLETEDRRPETEEVEPGTEAVPGEEVETAQGEAHDELTDLEMPAETKAAIQKRINKFKAREAAAREAAEAAQAEAAEAKARAGEFDEAMLTASFVAGVNPEYATKEEQATVAEADRTAKDLEAWEPYMATGYEAEIDGKQVSYTAQQVSAHVAKLRAAERKLGPSAQEILARTKKLEAEDRKIGRQVREGKLKVVKAAGRPETGDRRPQPPALPGRSAAGAARPPIGSVRPKVGEMSDGDFASAPDRREALKSLYKTGG